MYPENCVPNVALFTAPQELQTDAAFCTIRVEGLQSCLKLKELYLHSNRITQIKNLSHITELQVLWLANNQISWVEGLESLVNLKELSLARNPINQLGQILEMKSLECLNVAATNIGSFKVSLRFISSTVNCLNSHELQQSLLRYLTLAGWLSRR